MKIACISQVRDECDILELFFRNNVKVIDHFFIINNDSCDATQEILDRLIKEGLPITVHQDKNQKYDQAALTTAALKNISKSQDFDWYCFLDADEFLMHDRAVVENALSDSRMKVSAHEGKLAMPIVRVMWQTAVPAGGHIHKLLKNERGPVQNNCKVMIPKELIPYIIEINTGAHGLGAKNNPWPIVEYLCGDLRITHLPVRNAEQILSKAILSYNRMKRNEAIKTTHFSLMVEYIQKKNYSLNLKDLHYLASLYNADPNNIQLGEEIDLNWSSVKHKNLTEINIIKRLSYQLTL